MLIILLGDERLGQQLSYWPVICEMHILILYPIFMFLSRLEHGCLITLLDASVSDRAAELLAHTSIIAQIDYKCNY